MSLLIDPPFALGQTLGVSSTADGVGWVGAVKQFPDVNPLTGTVRSNRIKTCVAVRNLASGALLPKKVVTFSTTAGLAGLSSVTGYTAVTSTEHVGVVDEYISSAGVAVNDVFWVTVNGPTEVAAALSGDVLVAGNRVCSITAATSGATTAGRVLATALTVSGTDVSNVRGIIGYALSGSTTNVTASATQSPTPLCLINAAQY